MKDTLTIHIKHMVCPRCISAVEHILSAQSIEFKSPILLGEVQLLHPLTDAQQESLNHALSAQGFELLQDKEDVIINHVKQLLIEWIHFGRSKPLHMTISQYIAQEVGTDYSTISKLFSAYEGITIEKYIIKQKIERAKELLIYGEESLTEISYQLNYSSPQHLSRQFKQVTGMSASEFQKTHRYQMRKPLNEI